MSGRDGRGIGRSPRAETALPTRPAADLAPPIALELVPDLLRRRGIDVTRKRVQRAATAGLIPVRKEGYRHLLDPADLGEVERFFRDNPRGTARGGAAGLARAGRR